MGADVHIPDFEVPDPQIGRDDLVHTLFNEPQRHPDTCAITCQAFVIERFTGQHLDEDALTHEAVEHGWFVDDGHGDLGGTPPEAIGNLLDLHGIPTHRYLHASIFHLGSELAQGHKVILCVDSEMLESDHPVLSHLERTLGFTEADHAVVVSGIDTSDTEHVTVMVSDPATGEPAARYPMDRFLDAWSGSDFSMVATQEPAPAWLPEMDNFNYEVGHIDQVAGMPYDEFMAYEHDPGALAARLDTGGHGNDDFDADAPPDSAAADTPADASADAGHHPYHHGAGHAGDGHHHGDPGLDPGHGHPPGHPDASAAGHPESGHEPAHHSDEPRFGAGPGDHAQDHHPSHDDLLGHLTHDDVLGGHLAEVESPEGHLGDNPVLDDSGTHDDVLGRPFAHDNLLGHPLYDDVLGGHAEEDPALDGFAAHDDPGGQPGDDGAPGSGFEPGDDAAFDDGDWYDGHP